MTEVVLVHGLWALGLMMRPLARRLESEGMRCHTFSYFGRARPLEAHAERLARFGQELGAAHYVGHSLGSLVVLDALLRHPALRAGRVVLLAPPARGCASGRRLARHAPGRWLLGDSAAQWREDREGRDRRWTRPEPLGVVAGTIPFGLGRMAGRLPGANDGVVCVEETAVAGMTARICLGVSHSGMLVSRRVADNVAGFLADGRFPDDAR